MAKEINEFIEEFDYFAQKEDGNEIANLLSMNFTTNIFGYLSDAVIEKACGHMRSPFGQALSLLIKAQVQLHRNLQEAARLHVDLLGALNKLYTNNEMNTVWLNLSVAVVSRNTEILCARADDELRQLNKKETNLETAMMTFKRILSATTMDRKEFGKRWNAYYIVNICLKVLFRQNKISSTKTMFDTMAKDYLPTFEELPKSEVVTFSYYKGRFLMMSDEFNKAEEELSRAFLLCHKSHLRNRKRILQYLVPVRLLIGQSPSSDLLSKYGLVELIPLVMSVKTGNVKMFNDTLLTYESKFISQGIYLVIEKMKTIVYRNLFRGVCKKIPNEKNQYDLSLFQTSLKLLGEDIDMDEMECILVNLIFKKFIQGYISHKHKKLVTAKFEIAFPKISKKE